MSTIGIISGLTVASYAAMILILLLMLQRQQYVITSKTWAIYFAALSVVCHVVLLVQQISHPEGMDLSLLPVLSISTLLMLIVSLVIFHQVILLIVVSFLSVGVIGISLYGSLPQTLLSTTHWSLRLHVLTAIFAHALFALAAVQAMFLLFKDMMLKRHYSANWFAKLPPLLVIEKWLFQLLLVGFIFLSISIVCGLFFWELWWSKSFIHKTIFSLLAWVILSFLLYLHYFKGLRGRKAMRWMWLIFILLLLAFTGTKIVQKIILIR